MEQTVRLSCRIPKSVYDAARLHGKLGVFITDAIEGHLRFLNRYGAKMLCQNCLDIVTERHEITVTVGKTVGKMYVCYTCEEELDPQGSERVAGDNRGLGTREGARRGLRPGPGEAPDTSYEPRIICGYYEPEKLKE